MKRANPYQNLEAERSCLSCMLLNPDCVQHVMAIIRPDDFTLPAHRELAGVLAEMSGAGAAIDMVTVDDSLTVRGAPGYGEMKGSQYLAKLASLEVSAANVLDHARIVRDKAVRRAAVTAVGDMARLIEEADGDLAEVLISGGQRLSAIGQQAGQQGALIRPATGPVLLCMADVEARSVQWLWPGRVPLGRITLLVGRQGEGKSFLATDMAARVSTGSPWPDGSPCPSGSVILISAEDDPRDTIRPRLDVHHADVQKVHLLKAVRHTDRAGKPYEVMFTLKDVEALEAALKAHPDCALVVVDPIGSFIGGRTDAHRDNEVRSVLAPVAMLAEKYGPAVMVVGHWRKGGGTLADDLVMGSRAFTAIARAVWHLSRDPENKARRLLLPGKNNLAPEGGGLAFSICGEQPAIAWERDPVAMTADDAVAAENAAHDGKPGPEPEARRQATQWLKAELADGLEHPVKAVKEAAKAAGLSWRSVQRAPADLQVRMHRTGFGGECTWQLPNAAPIGAKPAENGELGTNGTNGGLLRETGDSEGQSCHTCQDNPLDADSGGEAPDV